MKPKAAGTPASPAPRRRPYDRQSAFRFWAPYLGLTVLLNFTAATTNWFWITRNFSMVPQTESPTPQLRGPAALAAGPSTPFSGSIGVSGSTGSRPPSSQELHLRCSQLGKAKPFQLTSESLRITLTACGGGKSAGQIVNETNGYTATLITSEDSISTDHISLQEGKNRIVFRGIASGAAKTEGPSLEITRLPAAPKSE